MSIERVEIIGGGSGYAKFESISVEIDAADLIPKFEARISETSGIGIGSAFANWDFPPGTRVEILANGDLLTKAIVEEYAPQGDANSHTISIRGPGPQRDLADCAPQHPTGYFENKSVLDIAKELAKPFGIDVEAVGAAVSRAAQIVPQFIIRRASTVYEEIMRLAHQRSMTLHGDREGKAQLFAGDKGSHASGLVQGVNIKRMSAKISDSDLFAYYDVIGQKSVGTEEGSFKVFGHVKGSGKAGRVAERVDMAATSNALANMNAGWWQQRSEGESAKATLVVPGWRDDAGTFWTPGYQVYVEAPWLRLRQYMLINKVVYTQDSGGGTISTISVNNVADLGGEAAGGSGSWHPFEMTDNELGGTSDPSGGRR